MQDLDSCCADPTCELPVYLFLLRDLNSKLEYFSPKPTSFRSSSTPPGLSGITTVDFVNKIQTVFASLRRHLDSAISLLEHGSESCQTHWSDQSSMAALRFSFMLASEVVVTLESVVISLQKVIDKPVEGTAKHKSTIIQELLVTSRNKLCSSAHKVLSHDWNDIENGWKGKGEMVQKIVHIYLENCESTSQSLDELACSILPTVSFSSRTTPEEYSHGFTTLCSSTFAVWYKELHEQNLVILGKLVKEAVQINKSKATPQPAAVQILMEKLHRSVMVVVALINICKTHDKVTVRTMAVKYGGKYVDTFLKVFEFLESQFQGHKQLIIQLFKDFQMGTRTIQTLCSEAKGLKQTSITCKVPATKRSLERFLFRVKALLHSSSSGCTFLMGNLKHKNLIGQVVSSQAYVDGENDNNSDDFVENVAEDDVVRNSEDDGEVARNSEDDGEAE
ncbi:hypothetical protein M8C21_004473 [Ambrosia artemisiifolia]|uniref:Uncharacterized protein n=1 Tax=Ambrosia artemisiifolia TaxID=4212 RepID=A0AAD5GAG9_AMBAR|nr:hypothetical protein M8C21_004473 [Ambrosia artemisiifolia]